MWPLGGLAYVEVPHTPRANFVTAAAGPFVNVLLCLASGLVLWFGAGVRPPWNPLWSWLSESLVSIGGQEFVPGPGWQSWLARFFYVTMTLCLLTVVLICVLLIVRLWLP